MWQTKLRGALGFVFGQLTEVIIEAIRRTAIKARPESRLAYRRASGDDHRLVIVRDATDHVGVRFDVAH